MSDFSVEIKICGLRDPAQAAQCVELGADAIGVVFFQKSPRNVSIAEAAEIHTAISAKGALVGVFVDCKPEDVLSIAEGAGLDFVQLHGDESPDNVRFIMERGVKVIKVLKNKHFMEAAESFDCGRFLLELGHGELPGGNGQGWNWAAANGFSAHHPFLLAGGLSPENVVEAIRQANPSGVDASSCLESAPGVKDMVKVAEFIKAVRSCNVYCGEERVFK